MAVTRAWGDRWLREGQGKLLLVRSVLVPETYNVLIKARHVDASQIQRLAVFACPLDSRLITRPQGIAALYARKPPSRRRQSRKDWVVIDTHYADSSDIRGYVSRRTYIATNEVQSLTDCA